jgi:outer membrane biosynthesis protein TonB
VTAAPAPRLTAGVVASVLLHGGLIAAFLLVRTPAPPPSPPMIMVRMFAAPAGDRAIGAVQEAPAVTPAPTPPKPVTTKPVAPTAKPKPAPKAASPTSEPKGGAKPAAAPKAGGGETGGHGADVANIDTPGMQFDYPAYTDNIVRQLLRYFGGLAGRLEAEVRFVIRRDGSVDPSSIKLVTSSGNYSFDQRALGAVESAANAKAFGSLPPGFREDILPVTFRFSPQIIK